MRVFVAGGTGVIGSRVTRLLALAGHDVAATSRSPERVTALAGGDSLDSGAVVGMALDILDASAVTAAVRDFSPDVVMHQVTDLPDRQLLVPLRVRRLGRVRTRGTDHLVAAASRVGASVIAQSVAFALPRIAQRAVDHLEQTVLGADGVVLRYGRLYGEGTWSAAPTPAPTVHVDLAARATVDALSEPSGVLEVLDSGTVRRE